MLIMSTFAILRFFAEIYLSLVFIKQKLYTYVIMRNNSNDLRKKKQETLTSKFFLPDYISVVCMGMAVSPAKKIEPQMFLHFTLNHKCSYILRR